MIMHKHHIVPRYMGGTDDPSNLVELTIEEHAQAHLELYNKHGDQRDLLAHRMLLGQIERQEANAILRSLPKTEQHKKKISAALTGKNNPMFGRKQSQKQKESVRAALQKWIMVDGMCYPSVNDAMADGHSDHKLRNKDKYPRFTL